VRRVCMPAVPVPFSPPLEDFVLPDQARIAATVRELLGYP
jgi:pyruvate/2-oxoglutarate/acetoin dehydrogenase E1 component